MRLPQRLSFPCKREFIWRKKDRRALLVQYSNFSHCAARKTKVRPRFRLILQAAQQVCRMISRNQRNAAMVMQFAAQTADGRIGREQIRSRDFAQRHDQFWLDQFDLPRKLRRAGRRFLRRGVAIAGRAALDDVGDINVFAALQSDCRQHIVE